MLRKEKRKSSKKIVVEENIPSQKTTSVIVMGSINDESSNLRIIEPIPSKTIICVVAGHSHFLCLTDTGNIFCYGNGQRGQLGLGEEVLSVSTLTPIPYFDEKFIVNISSNYSQSAAITGEGKLYLWGSGYITNFTPQLQENLEEKRIAKCCLGASHALALAWEANEYSLYSWGAGSNGQLGLGDLNPKNSPTIITTFPTKKITSISCGSKHSSAVVGGEVFVWGLFFGEKNHTPISIEFKDEVIVDCVCGEKNLFAISQNGKLYSIGEGVLGIEAENSFSPKVIDSLKSSVVKQVAIGINHCLCIAEPKKIDIFSEIYVWGETKYGKIGNNEKNGNDNQAISLISTPFLASELLGSNVIQITCGAKFTVILRIIPVIDGSGDEHVFEKTQINFPVRCINCNRFIWGIRSTWRCILCGNMCHSKCRNINLPKCEGGVPDSWTNDYFSDYVTNEVKDEVEKVAQLWTRAQSDFAIDFVRNLNHTFEVQSLPIAKTAISKQKSPLSEEERLKQIAEIKASIFHHKQQIIELKELLAQVEGSNTPPYSPNSHYSSNNLTISNNINPLITPQIPIPVVVNNNNNNNIINNNNNNIINNNINNNTNNTTPPTATINNGNNGNVTSISPLRKKTSGNSIQRPLSEMKRSYHSSVPNIIIDKLWEIDPAQVTIDRQLGEGASAQVYLGHYRGQEVAIKVMKNKASEKQLIDFECEFTLMREMKSKYNVFFYGACLNPNLCLIMEHCERGSLYQRFNDSTQKFPWSKALKMAVEMCKGVSCLHSWEPKIIHRDLKSHNLLVDWNWNIKIGDFGLARLSDSLNQNPSLGKLRGTYSYCAPEIYYGKPFTEKSDIFSIGIILWELVVRVITGKYERPYSEFSDLQYDFQIIVQTARGMRCTIPPKTPEPLVRIIQSCWDPEPTKRPTAAELTQEFLLLLGKYRLNKELWNSATL